MVNSCQGSVASSEKESSASKDDGSVASTEQIQVSPMTTQVSPKTFTKPTQFRLSAVQFVTVQQAILLQLTSQITAATALTTVIAQNIFWDS